METLIKEIEKYYDKQLKTITQDELDELEFLEKFINSYNKNHPSSIIKLNKSNLLLAILCTAKDKDKFNNLQEKIETLEKINTINNHLPLKKMIELIFKFNEKKLLNELSEIPLLSTEDGKIEEIVINHQKIYEKFYQEDLIDPLSELHVILSKCFVDDELGRSNFFFLMGDYTSEFFDSIFAITILIQLGELKEKIENPLIAKELEESLKQGKIFDQLEKIENRKNELENKLKHNQKIKKQKEKKIQQINKKLKNLNLKGSIQLTNELLELLPNEEAKFVLLKRSLIENRNSYSTIKPVQIKNEDNSEIEKLFKKYVYDFKYLQEKEKEELLTKGNVEQIKSILKLLEENKLTFHQKENFPIVHILLNTNIAIVETIVNLIKQQLITEEFIYQNNKIFLPNIFNNLIKNIELLKQKKINIKELNIEKILLEENSKLEENIIILEQYNFPINNLTTFEILKNIENIKYLDTFIELDLYEYIKENPNILNKDCKTIINKILLYKQLGIDIKNKETLKNIINNKFKIGNTTINDEDLEEYIENQTIFYENETLKGILDNTKITSIKEEIEIEELERFIQNNNSYNINGIIVSKNKVLRNYQSLINQTEISKKEILFNSIIYNSNMTEDEINIIKDSIKIKNKTK